MHASGRKRCSKISWQGEHAVMSGLSMLQERHCGTLWQRQEDMAGAGQQRAGSSREPYLTPPRRRQAPALLRAPPAATSLFISVILQRGHFLVGVHACNNIQCRQPLHGNAELTMPPGATAMPS